MSEDARQGRMAQQQAEALTHTAHAHTHHFHTVYNLADKGDTDQGKLAAAITGALGVEISFKGSMFSSAAVAMGGLAKIAEVINHNVMLDWSDLKKAHGIESTPLSPFLHPSLLAHNNLHVNGAGIEGE